MVKEPRPAPKSPIATLIERGVRSHLIISHVRPASRGGLSIVNTHPSARRLWGRDWIFAHNGTLRGFIENYADKLEWWHPSGETDSEQHSATR